MRRLLFFTGQRMLAYHWSGGRFRAAHAFDADSRGYQDFERFLHDSPRRPVRLMVDMIEEGFRIDAMPRAFGNDRRALMSRLLTRHFRTTSFRQLTVQERLSTGRRDYRVLVSGLTNPELLTGWVDIINRFRVPLEGIYSLPLVGEGLLGVLKADKHNALVITQQSAGAVRQSFYDHGRLRLSRLVPIRYDGDEGYAGFVDREVHNTLRFLESQRLLRRSDRMHVHVISPAEHIPELERHLAGDENLHYSSVSYPLLARRLGIRGELPTEFADGLFAQVLLSRAWPRNHYASPPLRTHHFHRLARIGINVASAATLVAALGLGGAQLIAGRLYESYTLEAKVEAARYQRSYDDLLREISVFPLQAAYVKDAVDMVRVFDSTAGATPQRLMSVVSDVFNRHPNITLSAMRWLADSDPQALPEKRAQARGAARETAFVAEQRREIATLEGHVVGFGRSYRGAVNLFDQFVEELRASGWFDRVEVRRTPFDIDSQAALSGNSGTAATGPQRERAAYELLLRLREGGPPGVSG